MPKVDLLPVVQDPELLLAYLNTNFNRIADSLASIDTVGGGGGGGGGGTVVPTGSILPFGSVTVPDGWLVCDGAAVDRTTFADLFAVIGTTFGVGNGSTTFNVPNLRDRLPHGMHATNRPLGTTGGATSHAHNANASSGSGGFHGHTASTGSGGFHGHNASANTGNAGAHSHSPSIGNSSTFSMNRALGNFSSNHAGSHSHNSNTDTTGSHSHSASVSVGSGGDHAHNASVGSGGDHTHTVSVTVNDLPTLPPYQAVNYIIKA